MKLGKDESKDDQEEKGLSTFQKDEEQTRVILPVVPFPVVGNPYPDQTPKAVLERWYQIGFQTITKSSAVNGRVYPVYELLNVGSIQDALATFRYIRFSSVSFRIQTSTVPMVYGYGYISSMPATDLGGGFGQQFLSFDDTVLIDYSVQNEVTLTIPWRTPDQWLDWYRVGFPTPVGFDQFNEMYRIIYVFNAVLVLDSTAVPSIRAIYFAKFNDLETAGHVDDIDRYERQSSQKRYFKDYGNDLYQHASYLSEQFMSFTGRGSNPNDVHRDEIMSHYNASNGVERPSPAKKAKDPSSDPSDPEVRNNPFGSLVSSASMYTAGSGSLMQPIRDFTVRDFINKPTYIHSLNLTAGMDMTQVWQLGDLYWSRINYMAQYFRMWRGSIRLTFVIFSTPFISARYNFVVRWGGATPVGLVGNELVNDITVRGTTRVDITVPFLAADQWLPTWCQMPGGYDYSVNFPAVFIKEQSPAVSVGDISAAPVMLIYESAGDDFEFRSLCNPNPVKDYSYERQMRIAEFSKQEVSGDGGACVYPYSSDTEMTFTDITRRWCNRNTDALSPGPVYTSGIATAGAFDQISCLFVYWSGQTKFKLTCATSSTMNCWHTDVHFPSITSAADRCARPEDGMVNVWTDLTRVLEFTAPQLATTSFLPIPRLASSITWNSWRSVDALPRQVWSGFLHDENNAIVVPSRAYVAGGEDFTFYFMLPPPVLNVWPQSVSSLDSSSKLKGDSTPVKHKGVVCLKELSETQSCTIPLRILDP